jgi:hypothetical protein
MQTSGTGRGLREVLFIAGMAVVLSCIALPLVSFGADKLVVKDPTGTITKFVATDDGKVGIGTGTPFYAVQLQSVTSPYMNAEGIGLGGGLFPSRNYSGTANPAANDLLGAMYFVGNSTLNGLSGTAATVSGYCDATGGTRIKGRITLSTSNGTTNTERMRIDSAGNVGVGTSAPTGLLDINDNRIRVEQSKTPASSSASCNQGEIAWDASYVYVCVAQNSWKRANLATW